MAKWMLQVDFVYREQSCALDNALSLARRCCSDVGTLWIRSPLGSTAVNPMRVDLLALLISQCDICNDIS
jgi:hypothetical protein